MAVWQEKNGANKQEEKGQCLQGADPVLPQGEGPPRGGTPADVFFDVLGCDGKSNERHSLVGWAAVEVEAQRMQPRTSFSTNSKEA